MPTFSWLCCCVAPAHLVLLAAAGPLPDVSLLSFLRPAAHEGVLRKRIHSELPLCFGSLWAATLILCSINAGQTIYAGTNPRAQNPFVFLRISADERNVNLYICPSEGSREIERTTLAYTSHKHSA